MPPKLMLVVRRTTYRVFNKYCVFHENFVIFLNSASSAAALVFYLPGVCRHTDIVRKNRVRNILKSLEKNTIFNEHSVSNYINKNKRAGDIE